MFDVLALVTPAWEWSRDLFRRRRRRNLVMESVATELHELRYLLAMVLTRVKTKLHAFDQATLDLVRPIFLSYKNKADARDSAKLDAFKQLLVSGDAEVIRLHNAYPEDPTKTIRPVTYQAPVLAAQVGDLTAFPAAVQRRLLRVSSELNLFNQQVGFVQAALDRTFDTTLTPANYQANSNNLANGTAKLAVRAAACIEAINSLLDADGNTLRFEGGSAPEAKRAK